MLKTVSLILPALLPSWRFFDVVAPSPRIEFRLLDDDRAVTHEWREFRPRPQRVGVPSLVSRLIWNPVWNETLFLMSCAERQIANPSDHSREEISKRIDRDLQRSTTTAQLMQFRLVFVSRNGATLGRDVLYKSPYWELGTGIESLDE